MRVEETTNQKQVPGWIKPETNVKESRLGGGGQPTRRVFFEWVNLQTNPNEGGRLED